MNEMQKRKNAKKRKLILLIPLFMISFAGVFYLAITAGNKMRGMDSGKDSTRNAFNTKLPTANVKEKEKNKLEIYMQAQEDSVKRKEALDKDPYEKRLFDPGPQEGHPGKSALKQGVPFVTEPGFRTIDPNEKKMNDRLEKLYSVLNQNTEDAKQANKETPRVETTSASDQQSALLQEKLLTAVQAGNTSEDPELKHIEGVLEKVLDIQHPDRIRNRERGQNPGGMVPALTVTTESGLKDSLLETSNPSDFDNTGICQNRFYELEGETTEYEVRDSGTILAVVHGDQIIHNGGKARLRLLQDIYIGKARIAKDNFIYGICSIGNERVNIRVNNITISNIIYPIHLTAFGTDGMEGIDVPGAIGQQAGKEGLNQALQNIELFNTDPSIGSQAAAASVQTVKGLMSRKVKQVTATLKTGQMVLLRNEQ